MQRRTGETCNMCTVPVLFVINQCVYRFQEVSYSHLLVPSRIVEPKTPIEDMMLDTVVLPKQHTLSR